MTRPPVRAVGAERTRFPSRSTSALLQEGWKILFFRTGRYQPDTSKSAEWNRGAYLAEGLSHCGACHTPRNLLGAEKAPDAYAGARDRQLDRAAADGCEPVSGAMDARRTRSAICARGVSACTG